MALIGQYHGEMPDWRVTGLTKTGELFGIELEVEHVADRQVAADAVDAVDYGGHPPPVVERDGSLSETLGVEIVCPPLPIANVMDEDGYIARLMRKLRESGVPSKQRESVGMHVNVNVVDWTPQEKLLVQWCLNAFYAGASHVGRRGNGGFGSFIPTCRYAREVDGSLRMDTFPGGKHSAAWLRSPGNRFPAGRGNALVMEARFPRSTLEIKELHDAIDYITAVRDWVRVAPNHTQAGVLLATIMGGAAAMEGLFFRWCLRYRPHVNLPTHIVNGADKLADLLGDGNRLEVMTRAYEKQDENRRTNPDMARAGFVNGQPGSKEQILRISTLISKGAGLEGESVYSNVYGQHLINPSSVRQRH